MKPLTIFTSLLVMATLSSCSEKSTPLGDGGYGKEKGEVCTQTSECGPNLYCTGIGICEEQGEPGTKGQGEDCTATQDCLIEYVCSSLGICVKPGDGAVGDECQGTESCSKGLVCSGSGTCANPGDPGTSDQGGACEKAEDCILGLVCADEKCIAVTYWSGATCNPDDGPVRAYFEIPRNGEPLSEFYRLPFPNDIRMKDGHIDLNGHPNPALVLPEELGDIVSDYFKAIEEDVDGFGVNTAVSLRTSGLIDYDTLLVNDDGTKKASLRFVNIDKNSKEYGSGVGFSMIANSSRRKYICENWIAVKPSTGRPLSPSTTYAVLLLKGIKDPDGMLIARDKDFEIVMGDKEPDNADEKAAWLAYTPLRTFLADEELGEKNIAPSDVISAAVFTTMNPRAKMAKFREVVHSQNTPALKNLTLCNGTAKSPCDDGKEETHVCPTSQNPDFYELQGIYSTPVFQSGTVPYETPADGGAISYDKDGKPKIQREDQVCVAISIPRTPMPQEGWPVVVFAHGTGGNYRTFINNGTAAALANIKDDGIDVSQMAVMGIDAGMHGPRRGSTESPDMLFFNFRNPRAARDNLYQAVADKYQLVRLIKSIDIKSSGSPLGDAISFNKSKVFYFGHSQGSFEGVPFAAYEPDVSAIVLSGAGGYLLGSFLEKTKPYNIAAGVQLALADGRLGTTHPLLNLLQLFFEEVDSINFGRALFVEPVEGVKRKHVYMSYGVADSYMPPLTIDALARAVSLGLVDQPAERCGDGACVWSETCTTCEQDCPKKEVCKPSDPLFTLVDAPVKENVSLGAAEKVTAAMVQYVSDGTYDDHFVVFQNATAKRQSTYFLGTAAKDGAPTIPAK
ncbi:MAG: hypothetical protein V1754_06565 [Pseudomonadota bacterium]